MASGFRTEYPPASVGVPLDLDAIFERGNAGILTGFVASDTGLDLGSRYAPLSAGSAALGVGFKTADGSDFNQKFAAIGTVVPLWPVGGGVYAGCNQFTLLSNDGITGNVGGLHCTGGTNGNGAYPWQVYNADGADQVVPCPATGRALAGAAVGAFGGFDPNAPWKIEAGMTFELNVQVEGLAASARSIVALGSGLDTGWSNPHSGAVPVCDASENFPDSAINVAGGFAPPPGFSYNAARATITSANRRMFLFMGSARNPGTSYANAYCYLTRIA